jgi:hypothetical protein
VLVRPDINGVFVMDFLKTQAILEMNVAFKDDLKRRLDHAINTPFELPPPSAPRSEKPLKKRRRRRFSDTGVNLWRMVAGGSGEEADTVVDRPSLQVGSAVVEPPDARKGNRRRT